MPYRIRFVKICLIAVAAGACSGYPQTPSPVVPVQTTQAPAPLSSPTQSANAPNTVPDLAANSIVGQYALTLDIGSSCSVIPEQERVSEYDAAIDSTGDGSYVVTLGGDRFLSGSICTGLGKTSGMSCNQFLASQDVNAVHFTLANDNDDAHGGHIVQRFPSGAWAEIIGEAAGALESTSISASGTATVWYCRTRAGYPFPCSNYTACASNNMQLKFTRK
jgi:hypothetical protein